jgi:hypothetical protein
VRKTGKVDLKDRFVELRAEGRSYADVAALLGISKPTAIAWGREVREEVEKARTLRKAELVDRFLVSREKRLAAFGKRLDAILAELDKRDLKDVKTDVLLTLALKYGERMAAEAEPLALEDPGHDKYEEIMATCGLKDVQNMTDAELVTWIAEGEVARAKQT